MRLAEELRRRGRTYWYRGQAEDWPVQSTFLRLKPEGRQLALEKAARYEAWIKSTPGLEHLASSRDAAIAVAQHYGIPTNFVDFTTNPQVAAFFASEKGGPGTAATLACIVCLDTEDLSEFWRASGGRNTPPEFLEIDVPDLWRIEAQRGCFLYCPYENIEQIYGFYRILFPNTHVLRGIKPADVYPERKSHLEILLDQYFMNERMVEFSREHNTEPFSIHEFESPEDRCDPEVFPHGLPNHASWSDAALRPWLELCPEQLAEARTEAQFRIQVRYHGDAAQVVESVADQLLRDAFAVPGVRGRLVDWNVDVTGDCVLPQDFSSRLVPKLTRLWDGLRRLPYNDEQLCVGLGMCVALGIALAGDFRNPGSQHWERAAGECLAKPIELEFGAEDGSYSRGYASAAGLAAAIRPDILSHVSESWKTDMAGNPRGILQTASDPRKTFDFGALTTVFATEIAPSQVLARETAVFYSPARLNSFGLP